MQRLPAGNSLSLISPMSMSIARASPASRARPASVSAVIFSLVVTAYLPGARALQHAARAQARVLRDAAS
jgi:hypothetical protein